MPSVAAVYLAVVRAAGPFGFEYLLAVTAVPPEPIATVSFLTNHGGGDLPRLSKKEAKASPPAFRDLLLSIARSSTRLLSVTPRDEVGT